MSLEPDVLEAVNRARAARGEQPLESGPGFYEPLSANDEAWNANVGFGPNATGTYVPPPAGSGAEAKELEFQEYVADGGYLIGDAAYRQWLVGL